MGLERSGARMERHYIVHYGQYIRCIMYIKHNLLSSVFVWRIRTKCIGRPTELCLQSEEGHSQVERSPPFLCPRELSNVCRAVQ